MGNTIQTAWLFFLCVKTMAHNSRRSAAVTVLLDEEQHLDALCRHLRFEGFLNKVRSMPVGKRRLCNKICFREELGHPKSYDVFMPEAGMTIGTYAVCCYQLRLEGNRKKWSRQNKRTKTSSTT